MIELNGQGIPVHKIEGVTKSDDPLAKPPKFGLVMTSERYTHEVDYANEENRDVAMTELITQINWAWANRGGK